MFDRFEEVDDSCAVAVLLCSYHGTREVACPSQGGGGVRLSAYIYTCILHFYLNYRMYCSKRINNLALSTIHLLSSQEMKLLLQKLF